MKTLLLCGYREERAPEGELIERRLRELRHLGVEPICVLAGPDADEQLRQCRTLAEAELAYDDASIRSLIANVRAGLKLTRTNLGPEPCFVLPVEIPTPDKTVWDQLARALDGAEDEHLLQLVDESKQPVHFGFPLLVTKAGHAQITKIQDLTRLTDTRLDYLSVVASATNT